MWIDSEYGAASVGDLRFVAEVLNTSNGQTGWRLSERPFRTNQSGEAKLTGWCGETNNRSVTARGLVRVTRVASQTDRVQVARLEGAEREEALATLGFPELA